MAFSYENMDYPRPLLNDDYRDMKHGYWNLSTKGWKDFNYENENELTNTISWISFVYRHRHGDMKIVIMYNKEENQAIFKLNGYYIDEDRRKRFRDITRYIPRPDGISLDGITPPTLYQTLCDLAFTDSEIDDLEFPYEVSDLMHLTCEEKNKLEAQEGNYDTYDYEKYADY